jgi:hypothetical protein
MHCYYLNRMVLSNLLQPNMQNTGKHCKRSHFVFFTSCLGLIRSEREENYISHALL